MEILPRGEAAEIAVGCRDIEVLHEVDDAAEAVVAEELTPPTALRLPSKFAVSRSSATSSVTVLVTASWVTPCRDRWPQLAPDPSA